MTTPLLEGNLRFGIPKSLRVSWKRKRMAPEIIANCAKIHKDLLPGSLESRIENAIRNYKSIFGPIISKVKFCKVLVK